MISLQLMEQKGTEAVKKMRLQKLRNGHPFMINSRSLKSNECYLEYPTGKITMVTFEKGDREFRIIRELTQAEAHLLRLEHQFSSPK